MELAFDYLSSNLLMKETDYPYTARDGTCKYNKSKGVPNSNTSGHQRVTSNSPSALEAAITKGPTSVAIEADTYVFQHYSGGVIKSSSCGTSLDHGVLAVGYGEDSRDGKYYIVKNSWGSRWGEKGYVKIMRDSKSGPGICGIQKDASYPKGV